MKLDNTNVDGINQKPSGYMILMTAGDRTFVAAEGEIGRSMIENKKERDSLIQVESKSKPI